MLLVRYNHAKTALHLSLYLASADLMFLTPGLEPLLSAKTY